MEMLDGIAFCDGCKMPMLSDGKGFYRHINEIPLKRLRVLVGNSFIAGKVFDWLCSLELDCPCCGPAPNPFKEIPRDKAIANLGTAVGAKDLFLTIRDLFGLTIDHPSDVLTEANRILKGK